MVRIGSLVPMRQYYASKQAAPALSQKSVCLLLWQFQSGGDAQKSHRLFAENLLRIGFEERISAGATVG